MSAQKEIASCYLQSAASILCLVSNSTAQTFRPVSHSSTNVTDSPSAFSTSVRNPLSLPTFLALCVSYIECYPWKWRFDCRRYFHLIPPNLFFDLLHLAQCLRKMDNKSYPNNRNHNGGEEIRKPGRVLRCLPHIPLSHAYHEWLPTSIHACPCGHSLWVLETASCLLPYARSMASSKYASITHAFHLRLSCDDFC